MQFLGPQNTFKINKKSGGVLNHRYPLDSSVNYYQTGINHSYSTMFIILC